MDIKSARVTIVVQQIILPAVRVPKVLFTYPKKIRSAISQMGLFVRFLAAKGWRKVCCRQNGYSWGRVSSGCEHFRTIWSRELPFATASFWLWKSLARFQRRREALSVREARLGSQEARSSAKDSAGSNTSLPCRSTKRSWATRPATLVTVERQIVWTEALKREMSGLIVPLVLCGGAGTRLWPASRDSRPKQFLNLFGSHSSFQETIKRVVDPSLFDKPIIITNAAYRFIVREQLSALGVDADVLLEPARRDSGPAMLAGSAFARMRNERSVVLALAADHAVQDPSAFALSCRSALDAARDEFILTFGVTPEGPSTEYGYIQPGERIAADIRKAAKFVEKPDAELAAKYVSAGYLWNSGNFMFRADALLTEYAQFDADTVAAVTSAVTNVTADLGFLALDAASFKGARAISIDYAVMEKTSRAAVVEVDWGWSDVGSWRAVWELSSKDGDGNVAKGKAIFEDSRNCTVSAENALVALEGVDDLVVVATEDAVLVSRNRQPGAMKRLVGSVRKAAPQLAENHLRVDRPWGSYQSLDIGDRHQVKRIVVTPGGRLSLQQHHHRAEHWVVVRGIALVTIDDRETLVHENESIYVPMGAVHRMANPGKILLELIEVQTGSYLGEDDIIRLEDDYKRS
ncbi:mannose-1-phosphate guanylyltransferase/mannose-6-phosphate isomerase [Bradyrhizobium sp. USDA 4524]|nr:mannose-1-phosphate guanylyltransferase/mannose-6-phosphate isomerase [Bradyrhizobium sp. USDA 4538]MCP1907145.1 mannose-1-phosphate guanylyltransferase/mannose-6-phosphate isomerase [Bradyrhizobium sp. USDA 4537]MCP1985621.1 mannose-1-phosphate guanylyltransferase/mannose-6-phosphate isomerase [Bradyrhizobium sp. USDA 4539]